MKSGFISLLVTIIVLFGAGYYVYTKSQVTASEKTHFYAETIERYPLVNSWQIRRTSFCLLGNKKCIDPPTKISFSTSDSWKTIYTFYTKEMTRREWSTNSEIITGIPTSVVFDNKNNCEASLEEDTSVQILNQTEGSRYLFVVKCN